MSRSGYSEDIETWSLIRWRGAVNSAVMGSRGQAFLRELAAALDAMPAKKLIVNALQDDGENFCTLGVIGAARGTAMAGLDPEDRETVAATFGIAPAMAAEIVYENDEGSRRAETPEARWERMRKWVQSCIDKAERKAA